MNLKFRQWIVAIIMAVIMGGVSWAADTIQAMEAIEARVSQLRPHPDYKDDEFGIIVVRQALISLKEGSGGIGACLVDEASRTVVATGRNRQFKPYFRSDMHAEMDLLTRYENWLRKKGGKDSDADPRDCSGLVLVSSVEPCPMCLTRIINAGIKKMVYVTPDETGGMVSRMDQLPPFWKARTEQCEYRQAVCSPEVKQIALDLFNFTARTWGMKKEGRK